MIHMSFYMKNTSEKIKEATLNLLSEGSYNDISMRKIAKEANVALGQLTYYYKTKNNLILSVVKEVFDVFYDEFEKGINKSENKIEEVIKGINYIINEDTKIERLLLTILSESCSNKKLQKISKEFWEKCINLISNCYKEQQENISDKEAILKARVLASSALGDVVEKILDSKFNEDKEQNLVTIVSQKIGGRKDE